MKKLLSIIALVFFAMSVSAQKKTFESVSYTADVVNDFGELTGEKSIVAFCRGYFSNSATTDSDAWLKIYIQGDMSGFELYEYNSEHASKDDLCLILTNDKGEEFEARYYIKKSKIKKLIRFFSNSNRVNAVVRDITLTNVGGLLLYQFGYTKAVFVIDNPQQFVEEYNKSKN